MNYTLEKESLNSTHFNESERINMVETLPLEVRILSPSLQFSFSEKYGPGRPQLV